MKITKINLLNFRNYDKLDIKFNNNMNIFVGNNAQGKTNILESIVILALTKSHRVGVNPNIIKFNKKKCSIKGTIKKNGIISKLEYKQEEDKKELFINNNKINRNSDYISNLNVIVFVPDDLEIIKGSPVFRRNLLNIELSQISNKYINTYNQYNKILKTRNEYLKILFNNGLADKSYLDILTDKLIEKAVVIYQLRNNFINEVNDIINDNFKEIGGLGNINIKYIPNLEFDSYDEDYLKVVLKNNFDNNYNKELKYGLTLFGPHRDDFTFMLEDIDLKYFGSQGQQKLAILAFKLSEVSLFKKYTNFYPILLLDDILSEFDLKKRNKILKFINNLNIQSIITTTDLKNINKKYLDNSFVFEVNNGTVERK